MGCHPCFLVALLGLVPQAERPERERGSNERRKTGLFAEAVGDLERLSAQRDDVARSLLLERSVIGGAEGSKESGSLLS